jgi:hypothetical protein
MIDAHPLKLHAKHMRNSHADTTVGSSAKSCRQSQFGSLGSSIQRVMPNIIERIASNLGFDGLELPLPSTRRGRVDVNNTQITPAGA